MSALVESDQHALGLDVDPAGGIQQITKDRLGLGMLLAHSDTHSLPIRKCTPIPIRGTPRASRSDMWPTIIGFAALLRRTSGHAFGGIALV